jgi:hypothetical protein
MPGVCGSQQVLLITNLDFFTLLTLGRIPVLNIQGFFNWKIKLSILIVPLFTNPILPFLPI